MSLRPSKTDDSSTLYYMSDLNPSFSKALTIGRRTSSTFALPLPALVPKSNDMTFVPTQHPKLTSYPSGSASVHRDQRPKLASHPSRSASTHNDCVRAQHGSSKPSPKMMLAEPHPRRVQSRDDDDDGSTSPVKVPKQSTKSPNASDVDLSKLPTAQLVTKVSKALSVDDLRDEHGRRGQEYFQEKRCSSGTDLKGLMKVMRLERLLLLLKKYLNLYQDFDDSSGDIFIRSTHEEFFTNINHIIVDIAEVALPLGTWSFNRSRKATDQAFQIRKTLRIAYQIRETWIKFFDWKLDISDPMARYQQEEHGLVRRATWEWRRRKSVEVVGRLLGLLADVEMDEGREGILDMQKGLRRRWREEGMIGVREAERRGWVCGVGL